ncbi:MAG: (2Fe-2S) ferredoxin domain-containing protein [Oligoflexia bacterium]|nr:(2Fe-2S) ferredoxin domain-containing protein [Oligoflexia bacterium]
MKKIPGDYQVHVFVCTNEKKAGECCAARGGAEVHRELKEWAKGHPEWKGRIRINRSGCLDRCSEGVAVAIYPQNEWCLEVNAENLQEVKEKIGALMRGAQRK